MSYNTKRNQDAKDLDCQPASSNLVPREAPSLTHLEKKTNNSNKRHSTLNSLTNDRVSRPSDRNDDTLQPKNTHMKQHQVDVTRLSPNNNNSKDFYSADNEAAGEGLHTDNSGGDNFGQIFSANTALSPSSSIIYHQHSINTYPSSSKLSTMLDDEFYSNSFEPTTLLNMGRESMLMKQAIKSTSMNKKRRESTGEADMIARKRPVSTSIIPRLTKSTNMSPYSSNIKHTTSNNSIPKQKRRHCSLQPISQKDRNNLASFFSEKDEEPYFHQRDASAGVHWDPHIDAFEILRAKITGITRSMQEFHVKELFHDENRKKKRLTATTSSPLITTTSINNSIINRRFSLTNDNHLGKYNPNTNYSGHRRIRSQSCSTSDLFNDDNNWSNLKYLDDEDEDDEEKDNMKVTSPNLTALFLTTNNLIHSRLDELSETASIKSVHNDIDEEVTSILDWQKKFLGLVTSCIHQSEQLESLSTDVLNTEHRVRELMLINDTIHEQFNEREKQYEERIRECQEVAQQQLMMIDSLEELNADINMKIESKRRETHRQNALLSLGAANHNHSHDQEEDYYLDEDNIRWNFQKSVAELLSIDDKHDMIQKMRWDIGMFVGGGVGTGHIIHSYEDNLNGIDMMIAGTGTTTTNIQHQQQAYYNDENQHTQNTDNNCHNNQLSEVSHSSINTCYVSLNFFLKKKVYSVTPSISHHIRLYQHQYVIHLNGKDRRTRFALLPKSLWIPDNDTNQCQFQLHNSHKRCRVRFTFFQRKHHCRKCGYIMCQKHSANRLPLFSPSRKGNFLAQWSRVCDNCFHNLIVQQ